MAITEEELRRRAVFELVSTERTYLRSMLVFNSLFVYPMAPASIQHIIKRDRLLMTEDEQSRIKMSIQRTKPHYGSSEPSSAAPVPTSNIHNTQSPSVPKRRSLGLLGSHDVSKLVRFDNSRNLIRRTFSASSDRGADDDGLDDLHTFSDTAGVLTEAEHETIFGLVANIVPLHRQLLMSLETALFGSFSGSFDSDLSEQLAMWDSSRCFGAGFKTYAHMFRMYLSIINNHATASAFAAHLMETKHAFQTAVVEAEASELADRQSLASFMIMPVQRLTRYSLLLREIIRHTPNTHPDFGAISEALELVNSVLSQLNQGVHKSEAQKHVAEIMKMIDGCPDLLAPHREVIKEGWLKKVGTHGRINEHYFVLFSDVLIYAKKGMTSLSFRYLVHVADVHDLPDSKQRYRFEIMGSHEDRKKHDLQKSFICCANDLASKVAWIAALQRVIRSPKFSLVDQLATTSTHAANTSVASSEPAKLVHEDASLVMGVTCGSAHPWTKDAASMRHAEDSEPADPSIRANSPVVKGADNDPPRTDSCQASSGTDEDPAAAAADPRIRFAPWHIASVVVVFAAIVAWRYFGSTAA